VQAVLNQLGQRGGGGPRPARGGGVVASHSARGVRGCVDPGETSSAAERPLAPGAPERLADGPTFSKAPGDASVDALGQAAEVPPAAG
jgi:hypothetical protein